MRYPHIPGQDDALDIFLVVLFGCLILGSLYGAVWIWDQFLEAGERLAEMPR